MATVAEIGTAVGTLVLAAATFAAVRSSNGSARLAERTLQSAIKPLLIPSKLSDEDQKVGFVDPHWVHVAGGRATAEATDEAIYLTLSLRNVGPGLALLNAWKFYPDRFVGETERAPTTAPSTVSPATSTSRAATSASGRAPCAIPRTRPSRRRERWSGTASRSRSTCCTAMSRADNG